MFPKLQQNHINKQLSSVLSFFLQNGVFKNNVKSYCHNKTRLKRLVQPYSVLYLLSYVYICHYPFIFIITLLYLLSCNHNTLSHIYIIQSYNYITLLHNYIFISHNYKYHSQNPLSFCTKKKSIDPNFFCMFNKFKLFIFKNNTFTFKLSKYQNFLQHKTININFSKQRKIVDNYIIFN